MSPSRFNLGFFPTPLHVLKNISSDHPNHTVYIKRDDHTGLATGGNKTRKLEYLIGDALDKGADTVITAGAQQSNHCRQTAAACAMAQLKCHLLLGGTPPDEYTGNLLLSKLLGATIHFSGEQRKGEALESLGRELRSAGHLPYIIPYGGSNLIGATGYTEAAGELQEQLDQRKLVIDYVFFASSSGGMHAGLILGKAKYGLKAALMPIRIDKQEAEGESLEETIRNIVAEGLQAPDYKQVTEVSNDEFIPISGFEEAGYGVVTQQERTAIQTLAAREGILLDPVYTGRAFYGMMHYLSEGLLKPGTSVLFWHTGGVPANFCYAREII